MNLKKLFEMQKALDEKIIREKGLEGQDLLPQKILALQVELGELANEWRGFKFWSKNQEPNTWLLRRNGPLANLEHHNPLLEEYVDCLHFILSIGLESGFSTSRVTAVVDYTNDVTSTFVEMFIGIADFAAEGDEDHYMSMFALFVALGKLLGFTWEQIESAYIAKNEVNHERQATGY